MARIINHTSVSSDGVCDVEVGDWFVPDGAHMDASLEIFRACGGMLLGRKTWEGIAAYWPTAEGEWADAINPLPKWVVSRSLEGPQVWESTAVAGDAVEVVAKLKAEVDGDLFMSGCGELARDLLDAGLIDEIVLGVHPSLVGEGERAFEGAKVKLDLLESTAFDSGVTNLRYRPCHSAG